MNRLLFVIALFISLNSFAGEFPVLNIAPLEGENMNCFKKGTSAFSAGYGFPNLGKTGASIFKEVLKSAGYNPDISISNKLGPLHFRYEYGVSDDIGLGASVNYSEYVMNFTHIRDIGTAGPHEFNDKITRSSLSVLFKVNFHFETSEKWDPYFTLGTGYRNVNYKFETTDAFGMLDFKVPFGFPVGFEATLGTRYYFAKYFGAYAEVGAAKSLVQAGVCGRF